MHRGSILRRSIEILSVIKDSIVQEVKKKLENTSVDIIGYVYPSKGGEKN